MSTENTNEKKAILNWDTAIRLGGYAIIALIGYTNLSSETKSNSTTLAEIKVEQSAIRTEQKEEDKKWDLRLQTQEIEIGALKLELASLKQKIDDQDNNH